VSILTLADLCEDVDSTLSQLGSSYIYSSVI